jgi:hypothetical protein
LNGRGSPCGVVEIVRGGRVKADERSDAMEQDYVPEVDRPRTRKRSRTRSGGRRARSRGSPIPSAWKGRSRKFALTEFYEVHAEGDLERSPLELAPQTSGAQGVARPAEVARQALDGSEIAITDPMERQRYSLVDDLD